MKIEILLVFLLVRFTQLRMLTEHRKPVLKQKSQKLKKLSKNWNKSHEARKLYSIPPPTRTHSHHYKR